MCNFRNEYLLRLNDHSGATTLQSPISLKSGFKPILYNKLGDIAYLYSASLVFDLVKTIDLDIVNLLTPWFRY